MKHHKFRVWNHIHDDWVDKDSVRMTIDGYLITEYSGNFTCIQCTGLTDKNDKEIYEGDILREDQDDDGEPFIGKIEFIAPEFKITWLKKGYSYSLDGVLFGKLSDYTIIGNIFENPELL